jgi:hypothetical protein
MDAEVAGYAEIRALYQVEVEGTPWLLVERVRPTLEISPDDRVRAFVAVEGALAQGRDTADELAKYLEGTPVGDRIAEFCTEVPTYHFDDVHGYLTVERAYVDWTSAKVDVRAGRQAVNWGSALVFNPTDLFSDVVASEPWRERRGVNAVRVSVAPNESWELLGLFAADDDLSPFEDPDEFPAFEQLPLATGAKVTLHKWQVDWSAVAAYRPDGPWFVGGDVRGTLGVGFWAEGGWHGDQDGVNPEGVEVVAGVDYSLPLLDRVYLAAEYRYDGTGEADPDAYDFGLRGGTSIEAPFDCPFATNGDNVDTTEEQPLARTTLGQHYVDVIANVRFLDDWGVGGTAIINVADGTGLLVPDVSLNLGDRWAVHVGAQIPLGEDGEFVPPKEVFDLNIGDASDNVSNFVPAATLNAWARYSF